MAVNTLIEVASSASSQTGCTTASEREISILLGALQNDSEIVRDAALRGLLAMQDALQCENDNLVIVNRESDSEPCLNNLKYNSSINSLLPTLS